MAKFDRKIHVSAREDDLFDVTVFPRGFQRSDRDLPIEQRDALSAGEVIDLVGPSDGAGQPTTIDYFGGDPHRPIDIPPGIAAELKARGIRWGPAQPCRVCGDAPMGCSRCCPD
jgi:hypothetical protein